VRGHDQASSKLRSKILSSLRTQGFTIAGNRIVAPDFEDKDAVRRIHETAVKHKVEAGGKNLARREPELLKRLASGSQILPERIDPILVEVQSDSDDEILFRYACLHWSIPVSSGYGRRLRFLVLDGQNNKLIGLFGLCDPVFSLAARDEWIGWTHARRAENLKCVMDAFVLGAVPPYSSLLCGKLVSMLVGSKVVREAFARKYKRRISLISSSLQDGRLALVTTTSALGRSSIYNRVRLNDRLMYQPVGFTKGSGEFHFSNGLYSTVLDHAKQHCTATAKNEAWGNGFRNRREVVKKCLVDIGLSSDLIYHGVRREIFCVPLAGNSRQFLRGEHSRLQWFPAEVSSIVSVFKERWLLRRAAWDLRYLDFDPQSYALWSGGTRPPG
jgi:hypothetical protein